MATVLLSPWNPNLVSGSRKENRVYPIPFLGCRWRILNQTATECRNSYQKKRLYHEFSVFATTEGSAKSSKSEEKIPSWAKPDADEPPPWAANEKSNQNNSSDPKLGIPFFVYLLASAVTAIAAIGSAFEYVNQKPVFGILQSDSIFYAPLLGFFAFTGIPTSAFLWFKSVQVANKEAEEQDRRDGFL